MVETYYFILVNNNPKITIMSFLNFTENSSGNLTHPEIKRLFIVSYKLVNYYIHYYIIKYIKHNI